MCTYIAIFSAVSDGGTVRRQILSRIVWSSFTTLRKDSVANYASIGTLFSLTVRGSDVLTNMGANPGGTGGDMSPHFSG